MHRHLETLLPRFLENRSKDIHTTALIPRSAGARVSAEIDSDNAPAQGGGDTERLGRVGGCVAAVDAKDEAGVHGQRGVVALPGVDGVKDGADVGFTGEEDGAVGGEDAAGGGAELEVGDAVGCEVGEDGAGCEG
jgi:hypothetical protein